MDRVIEVTNLQWGFNDDPPTVRVSSNEYDFHHIRVDPAPAYSHNRELVIETLKKCEEVFPLPIPVTLYNLHFDGVGRVNGETRDTSDYKKKNEHNEYIYSSVIFFFGKRTPIHPALTRYLVAHEYGHAVDRAIATKKYSGSDPVSKLRDEYMELRGLTKQPYYGPGTWHMIPAEVLANDFRYLVMGIEKEFWPHDVVTPDKVPAVVEWWDNVRKMDLIPGEPPLNKS